MQRGFEDISIIQIVIGILAYIIFAALLIWIFIIPTVKIYKSEYINYKKNLKEYYKVLNRRETLKSELQNYRESNKKITKALRKSFDIKKFKKFSLKFFKNVKVTFIKKIEGNFTKVEYKMDFVFDNINSFYNFFDNLNSYPSVIKIDFPIILEGLKPPFVKGEWKIEVYESNSSI